MSFNIEPISPINNIEERKPLFHFYDEQPRDNQKQKSKKKTLSNNESDDEIISDHDDIKSLKDD